MAQKSWFFNSAPGDPRVYQASDFAQYFGKVLSTGLLHVNEVPGLNVKTGGTDLRTYVEPGSAIMEGYAYENTANEYLSHSLPEVSLDRIDRVVLRLDKKNANRYIKLFVREGEPSSSPVPPTLQRDSLVWELSLAQVRIRANTSTINPSDVFDERLDRTVAGLTFSLISKPSMADIQTGGYAVVAITEGQTDFEIPLSSFDKVGDGLTVYVSGKKAEYSSYEVIYPRTVRFNVGLPIGTKVEFEIIRGVLKLADDYVVNAGEVGMVDAGGYYESENVEGALQKIGSALFSPKPKVYGVKIDLTDPNPNKSVVWTDDAQGYTQPSDLDAVFPFNSIKPCMLRDGVVRYYLNPNNYGQKIDGTPSKHTDFAEGDVMVEFPKIYWNIKKDSNYMYVRISEQKVEPDFVAMAHTITDVEKSKIYISAYAGSLDTTPKLRSTSGKTADTFQTLASYRTKVSANGVGYQQFGYYQMMLIQILFVIKYKSLNSDTSLGKPSTFKNIAGSTDTAGMYSGNVNGTIPIKFVGLEQIFSDYGVKVDGYINGNTSNNGPIYNDNGNNYENKKPSDVVLATAAGYISDVVGSSKLGFFPTATQGSSSSFFCDHISQNGGGSLFYNNSNDNGVFALRGIGPSDVSNASYARIVYIG